MYKEQNLHLKLFIPSKGAKNWVLGLGIGCQSLEFDAFVVPRQGQAEKNILFKYFLFKLYSSTKNSIFRETVGSLPFSLNKVHHVLNSGWLTDHIESPQPCVSVAGVEGLETVTQVTMAGNLSKFTGQIL